MIPSQSIQLIQAIKDTGKKLPINETGFLSGVSIQAVQGRMLTPKQAQYLQDIYQKVTDIEPINSRRK